MLLHNKFNYISDIELSQLRLKTHFVSIIMHAPIKKAKVSLKKEKI